MDICAIVVTAVYICSRVHRSACPVSSFFIKAMATIRIADIPHPKDERSRANFQDGVISNGGDGIYSRRSVSRSDTADPHDDIFNIRSRSRPPSTNRRGSRMSITDREDDDPGLRKPGDFKQKQVPANLIANLCDLRSFLCRYSKGSCFCGLPINQLELSMETLGPVLSTSTRRRLARRPHARTLLECSQ